MELQDFIKLHELKARATIIYDNGRHNARTSVNYTAEEHEELVSMLKELERYRKKEAIRESAMEALNDLKNEKCKKMSAEKKTFQVVIQDNETGKTLYYSADTKSSYFLPYKESATNFVNVEDLEKELPFIKGICSTFYKNSRYGEIKILETIARVYEIEHEPTKLLYLEKESKPREQLGVKTIDNSKNGPDIPTNPFSFPNNEVMIAAMKLQSCFRGSTFLVDREPIEFLADEKSNTYFILGNCETKEDVDCKVLEWISRAAYKTEPYDSYVSNKRFHSKMLDGINKYLGTDFEEIDMETIYTNLGNACNHEKTIEFVRSEFDMDTFLKKTEEIER